MSEINEKTKTVDSELLSVPEIKEAVELAEEAAYTPEELAAYDTYWDAVSTERTLLDERYQQGMEKGKVEGIEQGIDKGIKMGEQAALIKIATTLLAEGTPVEKIAHLTGLTESEIKELTNQN